MTEPILVPILTNIAASLIWDSTKAAAGRLIDKSPIASAIDGTTAAFLGIEDLRYTLRHWCETAEFQQLLKRLREGERDFTDDDVIDSFIQAGGFFAGESTTLIAENIITIFFRKLTDELYSSEIGITIYAQRDETLHKKSHDSLERIENTLIALIAVPKQVQIVQTISLDDIENHPVVREWIFHARVDEARDLLVAGKPVSARSNLWRLRKELAEQSPSVELVFRIATNLGACALDLGDTNTARKEFQLAVDLQPMNSKACANAALAELIGGDPDKALTLVTPVLRLERQDPQVVAVYIQVLYRLGRLDEIDQLVNQESWMAENAACTLVLGQLNYDGNKYTEAEHFLRK